MQLLEAQNQLRQSLAAGNLDRSGNLLDQFSRTGIYRSNDQVLLDLERGTIHYLMGNHRQSLGYFQEAEQEIDRLFGTSAERAFRALLQNDLVLEYQGEDYEDVMINLFNALSFIHLNDPDAATVEARRASFKLEQLSIRNLGLAETFSQRDTLKTDLNPGWTPGRTHIQASPFGHFLSYVIFSRQGREDNARIEYERFRSAFATNFPGQRWTDPRQDNFSGASGSQRVPPAGNVLILGFGGEAPTKRSNEVRIYSNDLRTYIKYSVPSIVNHGSRIHRAEAVINGVQTVPMPLLDDFAATAVEVFNVRRPLIVARAVVRSVTKHLLSQGAQRLARRELGDTAGAAAGILGAIFTEASEIADLRSWQTMPGRVHGQTVNLPPGNHEISIRYFDRNNRLIHQQTETITVEEDRPIQISEAFFWN